jgi:hypothetical protein
MSAPLPVTPPAGGARATGTQVGDKDGGPKKPETASDAGIGPLRDNDAGTDLGEDGGRVDDR